jgi:hypothetical protein
MSTRGLSTLALILVAALGVAACDDDNDNTNLNPTAPAVTAPSPSPTPAPTAPPTTSPAEPQPREPGVGDVVAFLGRVKRTGTAQLKIANMFVSARPDADITRFGVPATLADFRVGDVVRVKGRLQADNSIEAFLIKTDESGQ